MRERDYTSPIQERIDRCLRDLRRLVQVSLVTRGMSLVLVAVVMVVFVSFGLDRLFRLSHIGRVVTLAIYLGCLAGVVWKLLLSPLLVRLTRPSLADLLEKQFPQLDDRLRSAVDFLRDPEVGDTWGGRDEEDDLTLTMKRRVAEQAAARIESLETGEIVDTPRVVSALTGGIIALGAVGLHQR